MNKYFEQNLRLVDYIDGLMIVDKDCIIRHFYTAYPDIVKLTREEPINHSLFDIYPNLKREDSYICRVLNTGESFINYEQTYVDYKGNTMDAVCSAVPIKEQGEIIGVIDLVVYKSAHVDGRRLSFDTSLISTLQKSYNSSNESLDDIITQDSQMLRIKEKILDTADSDAHVLVYGKTGTGKELIVNAIQKTSKRKAFAEQLSLCSPVAYANALHKTDGLHMNRPFFRSKQDTRQTVFPRNNILHRNVFCFFSSRKEIVPPLRQKCSAFFGHRSTHSRQRMHSVPFFRVFR